MKTTWDYTELATAYLKRPDYAESAIQWLIATAGVRPGDAVCDVGAGVGHLTRMLCKQGLCVTAVEPNDAMRALGIDHTDSNVQWFEGTGEQTGQPANTFRLVTFGSSFNVTDRQQALKESHRLLQPGGWFACMWNHRDLQDPVQAEIEAIIRREIPGYDYGTRRQDQTAVIEESGLFGKVEYCEGRVIHHQFVHDVVEAWRSHATLERQAGDKFTGIVDAIEAYLQDLGVSELEIPYETRLWAAPVLK